MAFTDCSYKYLKKKAQKLGFFVFESKKHCKIKDSSNNFITMIPRQNRLKRETAKGIVEAFSEKGKISKEEIRVTIKC